MRVLCWVHLRRGLGSAAGGATSPPTGSSSNEFEEYRLISFLYTLRQRLDNLFLCRTAAFPESILHERRADRQPTPRSDRGQALPRYAGPSLPRDRFAPDPVAERLQRSALAR